MKEIELLEKRKFREKHFLQEDGSIIAKVYDENVHFLSNGKYEEVDNTLIKTGEVYINKRNNFHTRFNDKDSLLNIEINNEFIKIKIKDVATKKSIKLMHSSKLNSEIYYKNILPNIDIKYELFSTKVKESIILNSKKINLENLAFEIESNLNLEVLENGTILVKNQEKKTFLIESPFFIDANNIINNSIKYVLKQIDNTHYLLNFEFDSNWLFSDERKFPIIIDPTISTYLNSNGVYDTYIDSSIPTRNMSYKDFLDVGNFYYDSTDHIYRTLLKFELPTISTGSQIIDAKISLIGYPIDWVIAYEATKLLEVHRITEDWEEETATWNNMYDKYDNRVEGVFESNRSTIFNEQVDFVQNYVNITDLVKRWYTDLPNYGVMIKAVDETEHLDIFPRFFSKENAVSGDNPKPMLQIRYRNINGIENYIKTFDSKYSIGNAKVNAFNGNLNLSFLILKNLKSSLPFDLTIYYNTNDVILNTDYGLGIGYKFNFNQKIEVYNVDTFEKWLKYTDEDGTIHYFSKNYEYIDDSGELSELNEQDIYYDEDGLNLKIHELVDKYILYDSANNQMEFNITNGIGYLTKMIIDSKEINIYYNDNKITKIVDAENIELTIQYLSDNILINYHNEIYTIGLNNSKICSFSNIYGITSISYNVNNIVDSIIDVDSKKILFEYYDMSPFKVKKVLHYGLNNTYMSKYEFSYGYNSTIFTNTDNKKIYLVFNNSGNVVSQEILSEPNNIIDAYGSSETYLEDYQYKNKPLNTGYPIRYIKNYLKNTSFEENNMLFISNNMNISLSSDYAQSGYKSLKLVNQGNTGIASLNNIIVEKGHPYTFSCYIKNNVNVKLVLKYERGNETIVSESMEILPNELFSKEDITIDYPIDATSNLSVEIELLGQGNSYIDDIQLEKGEVDNNYNYIENSDFSEGLLGWDCSDTNNFSIVNIENLFNALRIEMKPDNPTSLSKTFQVKGISGDSYTISFWYKNNGVCLNDIDMGYNHVIITFDVNESEITEVEQDFPMYHCVFPSDNLNPNTDQWQFFTYTFVAEDFDYDSITLSFNQQYDANELFIANLCLYKDIRRESYNYDLNGNPIEKTNMNNKIFKYEMNKDSKKLSTIVNPDNNKILFEYSGDKLFNTYSMEQISTNYKYDINGNNKSIKIYNKSFENLDNNILKIRLYGDNKYINSIGKNILIFSVTVPTKWKFIPVVVNDKKYYKIKHCILDCYLSYSNNVIKLNADTNTLFDIEKLNDLEYTIKEVSTQQYLTHTNGQLILTDIAVSNNNKFFLESDDYKQFFETNMYYDDSGQFLQDEVDELLNNCHYDTNSNGQRDRIIDKSGIKQYTYNSKNQMIQYSHNDKIVNYEYNNCNLISKVIRNINEFDIVYDNFLRKSKIKYNNTDLIEYKYNLENSKISELLFGNSSKITYLYDDFNRLKTKNKIDSQKVYNYLYDGNGNLARIKVLNNIEKFKYDLANRLIKYINNDFSIDYSYNNCDCVNAKTYNLNNISYNINSILNKDNCIIITYVDNVPIYYNYDKLGRLQCISYQNLFNIQKEYIKLGKRTSTVIRKLSLGDNISLSYKYDKNGNIYCIYINDVLINKYLYDNISQLIKEIDYKNGFVKKYEYDEYGNILKTKIYSLSDYSLISIEKFQYNYSNSLNQLTTYNEKNILYDGFGNIVSFGNDIILTWANGKDLISYNDSINNVQFDYNDDSIRISKTVNNIKTDYYLDGNKVILEKNNNNVIYYIRDLSGNLIGFKLNNTPYYYLKNAQNDIIGILDQQYNVVGYYEYDSWGKILSITNAQNQDISMDSTNVLNINPYRYRCYYYDVETGLYYLGNRYYNPTIKRYMNIDNALNTDILGTNLYAYCGNNPNNREDNDGRCWWLVACVVVGGIIGGGVQILSNISNGNNWSDDVIGAVAGGMVLGGLFYVSPELSITGAALAGFTESATNEVLSYTETLKNKNEEKKELTTKNIRQSMVNVLSNTVKKTISNYVGDKIAGNFIPIGKSWFKPQKFVSSFFGKYASKRTTEMFISSTIAAQDPKEIVEEIIEYINILPPIEFKTMHLIN